LLNATLVHAAQNSPYYERLLKGEAVELGDLSELRRFPILTRELAAKHNTELLVRDIFPEYVACTGGTTLGSHGREPLRRFQTERERSFWVSLHESLRSNCPGEWPIEMRLITMEHGLDFPGALRGVFPMPLERPSHFLALISLLKKTFSIPGFSQRVRWLSGSLTGIKPLTLLCMERGIEGAQFEFDLICVHGWHVTRRWQTLLEEFWNVQLGESYGLSEVPGLYAVRCGACGHFHFSPLCINEVLDLDNNENVAVGIGRIVSTSFYPLNQSQPLLRYDTEDVIEILPERCALTDRFGFEYLGRVRDIVRRTCAGSSQILCHPIMLSEILGDLPDVAVQPHFRVAALGLSTTFGWQKYSLSTETKEDQQEIGLAIELVWSARSFPDAAKHLSAKIEERLLERSPALRCAISEGDVVLKISLCEPQSTDHAQLV
jgi:phenylacetate-coenzyme A ligase PaaK-like adenylate-forming protein